MAAHAIGADQHQGADRIEWWRWRSSSSASQPAAAGFRLASARERCRRRRADHLGAVLAPGRPLELGQDRAAVVAQLSEKFCPGRRRPRRDPDKAGVKFGDVDGVGAGKDTNLVLLHIDRGRGSSPRLLPGCRDAATALAAAAPDPCCSGIAPQSRTSREAISRRSTFNMVLPSEAGESATVIPALLIASILSPAPPLPPEMMAPAWPMRRPGGAVTPAMKPTIGFLTLLCLMQVGGLFLGAAADFADHDDRLGLRIGQEQFQDIDEIGAVDRVAADADAGGLAEAGGRGLRHRFVGQRARARDDADLAALVDMAGHDADLAFARGDDAGAVRADRGGSCEPCSARLTATMSSTGMPSVMQTTSSMLGVDRFEDRVGGEGRRHVDHRWQWRRSRRSRLGPC